MGLKGKQGTEEQLQKKANKPSSASPCNGNPWLYENWDNGLFIGIPIGRRFS
jgi:hypothetical protein